MNYLDTINSQKHSVTGVTPYKLVFGQPPKTTIVPMVPAQSILITLPALDNDNSIDFFPCP